MTKTWPPRYLHIRDDLIRREDDDEDEECGCDQSSPGRVSGTHSMQSISQDGGNSWQPHTLQYRAAAQMSSFQFQTLPTCGTVCGAADHIKLDPVLFAGDKIPLGLLTTTSTK